MSGSGLLVVAASQPSQGKIDALWFFLAGLAFLMGLFFLATAVVPSLHRWMLNDEIYNSGRRMTPGVREFMTRTAPIFGGLLVVVGVVLVVVGATS